MRCCAGRRGGVIAAVVGAGVALGAGCRPTFPYHDPAPSASGSQDGHQRPQNPYADVDWDTVQTVHSVSHHHTGRNPAGRLDTAMMGVQHVPFSEYYPSAPTAPLQPDLLAAYPDLIAGLNAEQHSCTNHGLHFNALGSYYSTGAFDRMYADWSAGQAEYTFRNLSPMDIEDRPWDGLRLLHVRFTPRFEGAVPWVDLSIDGATRCERSTFQPIGDGQVQSVRLDKPEEYALCVNAPDVTVRLVWDPTVTTVTETILVQGVHRPWQDAFHAALDGDRTDASGAPIEGLRWEEAGGITLNHPTGTNLEVWKSMLDFDRRVLGIEVWNQHFLFGGPPNNAELHFYNSWDALLRSGRQVFGFFVKDHMLHGQGRNILLVPPLDDLTAEEREREAMLAYREGRFFGSLGAQHVDASGAVVSPYDHSDFRFTRLSVETDPETGDPVLHVAVDGHRRDLRPNVQLRLITDCAGTRILDGETEAHVPVVPDAEAPCTYVRVEAFAYPNTHLLGQRLTAGRVANLSVLEIARLHDRRGDHVVSPIDPPGQAPISIAEMIFSQPIRLHTSDD